MNLLLEFSRTSFALRLGWTLSHFLWQGAAVAALVAVALACSRGWSASIRYRVLCLALVVMTMLPVLTFLRIGRDETVPASFYRQLAAAPPAATTAGELPESGSTSLSRPPGNERSVVVLLLPWLATGWIVGVFGFSVRLAGGWWQADRMRSMGTNPMPPPWPERLEGLRIRLRVTRPVVLLESTVARVPMVIGYLRPVILFPVGLASGLAPAQIEAILAHELAHLSRHDWPVNLAQRIVETVLFYHPAVWWLSAKIREERELCCDDLAAAALADRMALANALVSLAEREFAEPVFGFAADGGSVKNRVERLIGTGQDRPAAPWPRHLGAVLTVVALLGVGAWAWPVLTAPKLYQSTAVIQLAPEIKPTETKDPTTDATWLTTQTEMMKMDGMLGDVVDQLNLQTRWTDARRMNLSKTAARQRIRRWLAIRQIPGTTLVEIRVASPVAKEAADIGNRIANIYIQQSVDRRLQDAMRSFHMLSIESSSLEHDYVMSLEAIRKSRIEQGGITSASGNSGQASHEAVLTLKSELAKRAFESVMAKKMESDFQSKNPRQAATVVVAAEPAEEPTRWIER